MTNYFITATDTDAGKTFFACALVQALTSLNKSVAVYKPISAGCTLINKKLINDDAQQLLTSSNCNQAIEEVNPIAFEPAIAPHIAAKLIDQKITVAAIESGFEKVKALTADITITEGAGGWRLPLGDGVFLSDFVKNNISHTILVVDMKLGCLNHAILTYQAIIADGVNCVGWVANCQNPMLYLQENINELESLLPIPKLAQFTKEKSITEAAAKINLSFINV